MNTILPLLFVAVFGANNTIPTVGCQQVLDPLRKERDSICFIKSSSKSPYTRFSFISTAEDGDDAFIFSVQLNNYCTDMCLQARTNYYKMFGNDACKNDVFDFGGIDVAAPLLAQRPMLKNSGTCRKVNNQYCAVTEMNDPFDIDFYTTQNKTYLCTDCMKDYFSNPNELRIVDYISPEIAANSTKALNNYEKICGPVKKSSALGKDTWSVYLAVLLMYLGV
ncbi:hypothetical protein HDV02_000687 [Globomyces sp. JEL0801]|nr:hypothetical protein HDV02_000687 [Globomyces sp. JEL0801]